MGADDKSTGTQVSISLLPRASPRLTGRPLPLLWGPLVASSTCVPGARPRPVSPVGVEVPVSLRLQGNSHSPSQTRLRRPPPTCICPHPALGQQRHEDGGLLLQGAQCHLLPPHLCLPSIFEEAQLGAQIVRLRGPLLPAPAPTGRGRSSRNGRAHAQVVQGRSARSLKADVSGCVVALSAPCFSVTSTRGHAHKRNS